MRLVSSVERHGREHAGADLIGKRRDAEIDALAFESGALAVQRNVLPELVEQDRRQKLRPDKPRGVAWNGAGGWAIVSQSRQVNFSRTVSITFHWRGSTSSVSVISSPNFDSLLPPLHGQLVGASMTTRSR